MNQKASRKQIDFIIKLLESSNDNAKKKAEFLTSKGLETLTSKEASYCISILLKYNKNTDTKKKTVSTVKNDHPLQPGDVLSTHDFGFYEVIKATKKTVTVKPVSIQKWNFTYKDDERNAFHSKPFTKKVHCYDQKPTKKSYFIEPLGVYSMSPTARYYDTKENIIKELAEEKQEKEKQEAIYKKQAEDWQAEETKRKEEKEKIRSACNNDDEFLRTYYGVKSITNTVNQDRLVKVRFPALNKNNTLEENNKEIEADSYTTTCIVMQSIELTNDRIFKELLTDNPLWKKTGGSTMHRGAYSITMVTEVIYNNRKYYINTEGFNYARYVGIFEENISFDELLEKQPFNSYIKKAIKNAIDLIENISNHPQTETHFIDLVMNDSGVKSIMNMYGYDLRDKSALKNELKRYYKKINFNIYTNKSNCIILDFGASRIA